ncbi:MAG: polyhydroxyalkanoic acid system family protein [Gammaproteobacteria bacterium]|nr:polyhydroxyalkanoic acid system family protein [Gammaproteobacteria bacterium]
MSNVRVCREHNLGEQECQNLAEELLNKLVDKFGGSYQSNGTTYSYKHTAGVNAVVEPKVNELVVDVKLGIMARAFAPQLKSEMNKVLDEYID